MELISTTALVNKTNQKYFHFFVFSILFYSMPVFDIDNHARQQDLSKVSLNLFKLIFLCFLFVYILLLFLILTTKLFNKTCQNYFHLFISFILLHTMTVFDVDNRARLGNSLTFFMYFLFLDILWAFLMVITALLPTRLVKIFTQFNHHN